MAQNIDNKKTTLSDDAAIYKRDDVRSKSNSFADNWRNLDKKGKWQYFKDYMLKSIIIAIVVVGLLVYIGVVMVKGNHKTAYSIHNISYSMDKSSVVAELEPLDKLWNLSKKEIIEYDDNLSFDNSNGKLFTFMTAGSVDAIIGTVDDLKKYGRFFEDLSVGMPEVYSKIPEDAKVSFNFMAPKNDGTDNTEEKTAVLGIKITKTILAPYIYGNINYTPDSLVIVFVANGINNTEKNYDDDVAKLLLGIE